MEDQSNKDPFLGFGYKAHESFPEGSIWGKTLTEETLAVLVQNARIGSRILFRKVKNTSKGEEQYSIRLLPPFNETKNFKKDYKKPASSSSDLG